MSDSSLIESTNALLKQLLELHETQDKERVKEREASKKMLEEMRTKLGLRGKEAVSAEMQKLGVNPEQFEGVSDKAWQQRQREAGEKSKERLEAAKLKAEAYQQELLSELRKQTLLLERIRELLDR